MYPALDRLMKVGWMEDPVPLATQLRAALRYWIRYACDIALRPVDSVLRSLALSRLFAGLVTLAYALSAVRRSRCRIERSIMAGVIAGVLAGWINYVVAALVLFVAKRGGRIRFASGWMLRSIATLAVWLAGPGHTDLCPEWDSHLSDESGGAPPGWTALRSARGLVVAAIRIRLHDAATLAWRPVDYLLGSNALSAAAVLLSSLGFLARFFHHGGTCAIALNALQAAGSWAATVALIAAGRRYRGVAPPHRESRRDEW